GRVAGAASHPAAGVGSAGEPSGAAGSIRDNGTVKLYRDEAIVLRTHKLGEADRIVTMLTRRYGQVRGVAKGVRRTSSKFGARLEPFSVIDVQLHIGRSLDVITQVETLAPHGRALGADYSRYTTATAMVEAAARLTDVAGEPTTQQYLLLAGALSALAEGRHPNSLTLDSYLLRALAIGGWAPSFTDCARCGAPGPHRAFTPALGGAVCSDCRPPGAAAPSPETLQLLGALLAGDWQQAEASPERCRTEASGLVAAYAHWHLERRPRSSRLVARAGAPRPTPPRNRRHHTPPAPARRRYRRSWCHGTWRS